MRILTGAALAILVTTVPLAAAAEPTAGPPKPGKKCSVAAEGVGSDATGAAAGLLATAAVLGVARARRRSR